MTSNEIRSRFLGFFRDNGHSVVPSSSLIPANDPTLLFINAGMVQFKDVFLGRDRRSYTRATTSQRCVRAGGKHNDLENVGYTARHHTFFEMLGNFSFGDYFKREAIQFAWRFLTLELGLAPDKLWVTVFEQDSEAEAVWIDEIGVDPNRLSRIGAKDNFWSMGDTGPCGPCSEIFYDHGEDVAGGPPGSADEDGDRYIEIWNLVFMQYDRQANGKLEPLPKPSVDTGMGLERIAAVLQGVHDNYDIDLFRHLIKAAARITGASDLSANSLKVIADHIRASAFLIADGIMPSNEGRGYVLRRIMRRAVRHGYKLGCTQPFLHKLLAPLIEEMGQAYPELCSGRQLIERVILQEEERFAQTLAQGMRILDQAIMELAGDTIPGETAFLLYDTYGFPVDLTADVARERALAVDLEGFEQHMQAQRERARAASQFGDGYSRGVEVEAASRFTGYDRTRDRGKVVALVRDGQRVPTLEAGQHALVILDRTPFYAESGGQIGDRGTLAAGDAVFAVADTQSQRGTAIGHWGALQQGVLHEGDRVDARVDEPRRLAIMRNHSATHLLHAALRKVLGEHVTQKGSLVAPDRLRFDFSHFEPVSWQRQAEVEQLVNQQIISNLDAQIRLTSYHEAISSGAVALFGEKYGDQVRMLDFGGFSTELCGGTHVRRTGDIGLFKITEEQGIAAGVRRIEAVSGEGALHWVNANEARLREIAELVRGGRNDVLDRVRQSVERNRTLEKQVEQLKGRLAARQGGELAERAREVAGVRVLAADLEGADARTLRDTADQLKNKLGSAIVLLGAADAGKVALVAGVTADLTPRIKAGELVNFVASQVGGRGGGRPDMAQAGGNRPERLPAALNSVEAWVVERLAAADV